MLISGINVSNEVIYSCSHYYVKCVFCASLIDLTVIYRFFQLWKTSWMHSKALQAKGNQMKQLRLTAAFAKWK